MPHTISEITSKDLSERIAKNLRRIRTEQGMSLMEFSKNCRCHPDTLKFYETGKRTRFEGLVILLRAAKTLDVPLEELLG